jgi:hypothetical protein
MSLPCWSSEILRAFLGGRLTSEDEAQISAHVQECPRCEQALETLADDPAARAIAQRWRDTSLECDGQLEELARRVEAATLLDHLSTMDARTAELDELPKADPP